MAKCNTDLELQLQFHLMVQKEAMMTLLAATQEIVAIDMAVEVKEWEEEVPLIPLVDQDLAVNTAEKLGVEEETTTLEINTEEKETIVVVVRTNQRSITTEVVAAITKLAVETIIDTGMIQEVEEEDLEVIINEISNTK